MSYAEREESVFQGQPFELYWFEAAEGTWRLTSGDKVRSLAGQDYTPVPMRRTQLGKGSEQKTNTMTVTLPRDHAIGQLFIGFLPAAPVSLVVYRGHEGEAEDQVHVKFTGTVLNAAFGEDCELNCAPEEHILRQRIPRARYQTPCPKIIYSAACGVDPEDFKTEAALTAVSGDVISAAEFGAQADGWFTNGYLEWGEYRRMIIRHAGNDLTLIVPVSGLEAGAAVIAHPGCARTYVPACIGKFSNGPNFWGFPWIPKRNPFKGVEWS